MIRSNEGSKPAHRGTIIMDLTALLRLSQPVEPHYVAQDKLHHKEPQTGLDVVHFLAEQGYKIIVSPTTCYQLSGVLDTGFETTDLWNDEKAWCTPALREFTKLAVTGRVANIDAPHDNVTEVDIALQKLAEALQRQTFDGGRTGMDKSKKRSQQETHQRELVKSFNDRFKVYGISYADANVEALIKQHPGATLWTEKTAQGNTARELGAKVVNTRGVLEALRAQGLLGHVGLAEDIDGLADSLQIKNDKMLEAGRYLDRRSTDGAGHGPDNGQLFQKSLEGIKEVLDAKHAEETQPRAQPSERADKFKNRMGGRSMAEILAAQTAKLKGKAPSNSRK